MSEFLNRLEQLLDKMVNKTLPLHEKSSYYLYLNYNREEAFCIEHNDHTPNSFSPAQWTEFKHRLREVLSGSTEHKISLNLFTRGYPDNECFAEDVLKFCKPTPHELFNLFDKTCQSEVWALPIFLKVMARDPDTYQPHALLLLQADRNKDFITTETLNMLVEGMCGLPEDAVFNYFTKKYKAKTKIGIDDASLMYVLAQVLPPNTRQLAFKEITGRAISLHNLFSDPENPVTTFMINTAKLSEFKLKTREEIEKFLNRFHSHFQDAAYLQDLGLAQLAISYSKYNDNILVALTSDTSTPVNQKVFQEVLSQTLLLQREKNIEDHYFHNPHYLDDIIRFAKLEATLPARASMGKKAKV